MSSSTNAASSTNSSPWSWMPGLTAAANLWDKRRTAIRLLTRWTKQEWPSKRWSTSWERYLTTRRCTASATLPLPPVAEQLIVFENELKWVLEMSELPF